MCQPLTLQVCDFYFDQMLHKADTGILHSIYSGAVNFMVDNDLYTILSGHSEPAPYAGNVMPKTDFTLYNLAPDTAILIDSSFLYLSEHALIDITMPTVIDIKAQSYPFDPLLLASTLLIFDRYAKRKLAENRLINGCMQYYGQKYLNLALQKDIITKIVGDRIDAWLFQLNYETVFTDNANDETILFLHLSRLIGAGHGLTPSGDDFISGFFAALNALQHDKASKTAQALRKHLTRLLTEASTTEVSKQMLKAHLNGLMPAPHSRLLLAALSESESFSSALTEMEQIGHCSGLDFAVGTAAALHYILEKYGEYNVQ